jgi:alpha-galactosidase
LIAILTARDVIAINQDPAGKQGFRALSEPSTQTEIWVKELSDGAWAVCALNTGTSSAELTVNWEQLWTIRGRFEVRDVWAKKSVGDTSKPYRTRVASHDVALLRLTPVK